MRVLVLGQGGREHALIRALYLSPSVAEVHVAPGSDGMTQTIRHNVDIENKDSVLELCKKFSFDLVVVGPELPLVKGVSDALRQAGIPVFGPSSEAAQLEGSKIFNKQFLVDAKVPTADFFVVSSVEETLKAAASFASPYVLKADGLAAGKGVYICSTLEELKEAASDIFEKKVLGAAGERALLERFKKGYELSFFILTNGEKYVVLPMAQDHKKIGDGETGPNTGGMGAVAPIPVDPKDFEAIISKVVEPTIAHLKKIKLEYRGILFIGLMMMPEGPSVLEFNVRFGDPEAQVLLPLLDGDWGQVFLQIAKGQLPTMKWHSIYAACVVMAAEGYPASVVKGTAIKGDLSTQTSSSYILHAGTKKENGVWTVNGGRVLNLVGLGSSLKEAIKKSYDLSETIEWKGSQMRRDIGKKYL
jgi:phosphoribosylamine---glycine ligase